MANQEQYNQYAYLMNKGEGTKGANYRYTWRPDWRIPPGVKAGKVILQLAALLAVAAVPIYGPGLMRGKDEAVQVRQDHYLVMKQKNREQRLKWMETDGMPYK